MKDVILKKEYGEVGTLPNTKENREMLKLNAGHLCINCEKCRASECEKVFNLVKKSIGEYSFITDGFQIYDEDGNMEKFVVTDCCNFKQDLPRKKITTKSELERLKYLKESIKMSYFDAMDLDEANKIEADLKRRKVLADACINGLTAYYCTKELVKNNK